MKIETASMSGMGLVSCGGYVGGARFGVAGSISKMWFGVSDDRPRERMKRKDWEPREAESGYRRI